MDIRKAFDTADHTAMLLKLKTKGVRWKIWHVIADLYKKGNACVKMNGHTTATYEVKQGVAQGWPLSPILYIMFMDDLLDQRNSADRGGGIALPAPCPPLDEANHITHGQGYADDLLCLDRTVEGLQSDIDICYQHSKANVYKANTTKSSVMIFDSCAVSPVDTPPPRVATAAVVLGGRSASSCHRGKISGHMAVLRQ